jgi:parallel beta-helix repeat protein
MRMRAALTAVTVTALLGATGAGIVQADTRSSEGFEYFATGDVNNQFDWQKTGSSYDVAVVNPKTGFGVTDMGTRALRMSNSYVDGGFAGQTFSAPLANEAGETAAGNGGLSGGTRQRVFTATFSLRTTQASEQEGLYASISPDRGDGARMSYLRLEDQGDGVHVFFDDYVSGSGFTDTDIATLTYAEKHTLGLTMIFVGGPANDIVRVSVDGSVVHLGTSWEDYFRDVELTATRTVDSLLFREGSNDPENDARPSLAGQGFLVDDVVLTSGPTAACAFTTTSTTMTLVADCTTDHTISVPQGLTLEGANHTITAVDPAGDHFRGAVVQNVAGATAASVNNLRVTASNLSSACDAGSDSLAGIRLAGASGSITGNTVTGLQQGGSGDGCQEGDAIEVRRPTGAGSPPVTISGNTVSHYQKTGILVSGSVTATVANNTVGGYGKVDFIAQNGIQISGGATGRLSNNSISDNFYTPKSYTACGVLIYKAGGLLVDKNNSFNGNEKDVCTYGKGGTFKPV